MKAFFKLTLVPFPYSKAKARLKGASDSQTCNYTHDDMARVASANCGSLWNQTFSYDAFGNITKSATIGISFTPGYSATTNQFTSLPGITPTYDADGRLTYDGANHYTWDVDSKLHTVDTSPSTTVTYDALGRMVEKAVGTTYTQIVYGPSGSKLAAMNGQTLLKAFIPLPGGGTAVYTSAGLAYYRHSDHLGSSRLATTPSRTLYSSTAYAPFGEPYAQAGTTDLSFTGQDQDTASGMHDFLARKYTTTSGRWLSPDPAGLAAVDPSNPQTWNRYAYVMNNPMSLIDPFGEDCYSAGTPGSQDCGAGGSLMWQDMSALFSDPFVGMSLSATTVITGYRSWWDGIPASLGGDEYLIPDFMTVYGFGFGGGGGGDANKPWESRDSVISVLKGKTCSDWFNKGKGGSAVDIMSKVPILRENAPASVGARTDETPWGPIYVNNNGNFYYPGCIGCDPPMVGPYVAGGFGARMVILLHELAHKVQPPGIVDDGGVVPNVPASMANTQLVVDNCATAINSLY